MLSVVFTRCFPSINLSRAGLVGWLVWTLWTGTATCGEKLFHRTMYHVKKHFSSASFEPTICQFLLIPPLYSLMWGRAVNNPSLFTVFMTSHPSVWIPSNISSLAWRLIPVSCSSDRSSSTLQSCCPSLNLSRVCCILYEMGRTRNAYSIKELQSDIKMLPVVFSVPL